MCIPSPEAVMASKATVRLANWQRHRDDPDYGEPYHHHDEYVDGSILTRAHIVAHFGQSIRQGVTSAIKWGYPRGITSRGQWTGLSAAFRSDDLVREIEALRAEPPRSATEIIQRLNHHVAGVGAATTSKLAYFAGVSAIEGRCLIYDSMVRRAIRARSDPEFADLKQIIGERDGDLLPYQHAATYGRYLQAAHAMAARLGVQGDQIELFLFIGRENAAALPPYP